MSRLVILSATDQVTAHLGEELRRGTWKGRMPGGGRLAAELGVGRDTVETALQRLEAEGLLLNQGRRRGRSIVLKDEAAGPRGLRLGLLLDETANRRLDYVVAFEHELEQAGHVVFHAPRVMAEVGTDARRIAAMVNQIEVDAWLVMAGSRQVLEWFSGRRLPTFAIFGRRDGLPLAGVGPDKISTIRQVIDALVERGHRRIVMLVRRRQLLPKPGKFAGAFLEGLAAHGITPGPYHLPDWEESVDGLHAALEALYRVTPPSALVIDEAPFFVAAQHFLASRGLGVPEHVSLVCNDDDPAFSWCKPAISRIRWDSRPVVKRILQWADNVSRGKKDLRQTLTPAQFVTGGTIGPAAKG